VIEAELTSAESSKVSIVIRLFDGVEESDSRGLSESKVMERSPQPL
jgi:hypothetical protein